MGTQLKNNSLALIQILRRHIGALLLAGTVAGLLILPQHLLKREAGSSYRGILFTASDSELYYDARIRDVYDGHFKLANAFAAEYKNLPYLQPPLPEWITAAVGFLSFHDDPVIRIFFATRIALPFLLTLLIYLFLYRVTNSRGIALVGAASVMIGMDILQNWRYVMRLVPFLPFGNPDPGSTPLTFSRPISPQMGVLFFFLYATFFWEWLTHNTRRQLYVAGVVLGLSFYVYIYTWAFVLMGNFLLGLLLLWRRQYTEVKQLLLLHAIALLVALPYAWNVLQFYQVPNREFLAYHNGQFPSRRFYMSWSALLGLACVPWIRARIPILKWWLAALLTGGFIALNQQVITGQELSPNHFHWYFISVVSGIAVLLAFFDIARLKSRRVVRYCVLTAIITLLLVYGARRQVNAYQAYREQYLSDQRWGGVFQWLQSHTAKDSVILTTDRNRGSALAFYTHNNPYYASFMFLSNTPMRRLEDMQNLRVRLMGVTADAAEQFFLDNPELVADFIGGFSTRRRFGCRSCFAEPEKVYRSVTESYRAYLQQDMKTRLDEYGLDYVVFDHTVDRWDLGEVAGLSRVAQVDGFDIYRYPSQQK